MPDISGELSHDLDGMDSSDVDWSGEELCVLGKTMKIEPIDMNYSSMPRQGRALEGIVPNVERDYNHITVSDLSDLDSVSLSSGFCEALDDFEKPMPVDWLN